MPELAAGVIADEILRMLKQLKEFIRFRTLDLGPILSHGLAFEGNPPNASALGIPTRITHRVLGMPDDPRAKIGHVHASVQPKGNVHRPEQLIGRRQKVQPVAPFEISSVRPMFGDRNETFPEQNSRGHALLILVRKVRT